jgi:hypothetical protein
LCFTFTQGVKLTPFTHTTLVGNIKIENIIYYIYLNFHNYSSSFAFRYFFNNVNGKAIV